MFLRGAQCAHGNKTGFVCGFHAWRYNLDGKCTFKLDESDWKGALTDERTRLNEVKVDTWGGWIFINMDPNAVSLREYLEPAASILDPFELGKMRYKWRQWVIFDCQLEDGDRSLHGAVSRRRHAHADARARPVLRVQRGLRTARRERLR